MQVTDRFPQGAALVGPRFLSRGPCAGSRVRLVPSTSAAPLPASEGGLCPQAQLIAQSIGQAFSVAYQEFLRANGINPEDLSQKEYSDIINTQEMYNDDLIHFSNSENCKEVNRGPGGGRGPGRGRNPRQHPHVRHRLRCLLLLPGEGALVCEMRCCCNRQAGYNQP